MNPALHSFYPTSMVLRSIGSKRNSVMLFLTSGTSRFGSALTPNLFRSSAAFLALRIPLQMQWTRLKACATGIRPKLPGTLSPSTSMRPALVGMTRHSPASTIKGSPTGLKMTLPALTSQRNCMRYKTLSLPWISATRNINPSSTETQNHLPLSRRPPPMLRSLPKVLPKKYFENSSEGCLDNLTTHGSHTPPDITVPKSHTPTEAPSTSFAQHIADLGPDSKLKPEERQRCMDNGLCLRCGEPGHMVTDCPRNNMPGPLKGRAVSATPSSSSDSGSSGTTSEQESE